MYCQIDGISMGSPLDPMMVNIFVEFYEQDLLACIKKKTKKTYFYFWYVDDILLCSIMT